MLRACSFTALTVASLCSAASAQDVESGLLSDRFLPVGYETPAPIFACDPWDAGNVGCAVTAIDAPPVCHLRFSIPAWLPEVHGAAIVRGREAPVNITTRKMFESVEDLNFVFAGRVEADVERWGILAEGIYLNLSESSDFVGDRINVTTGVEQAIAEAAMTYDLLAPTDDASDVSAEILAGARYWLVGSDGVTVTGPRGRSVTTSGNRQWVDPIVGGRIAAPLSEAILMRLRADVGGFGAASDFTWNIEAVGEYRCSDCCGLQLGYRVLDVDYARGDGFAYDVNYRGPIAMLTFDF